MKLLFSFLLTILFFSAHNLISQNSVITFDGIDDYVDLGNNAGVGVRTIEMWFKPNAPINSQSSNYSPLIVRDENPNNNEFGLTFLPSSVGNSGQLLFYIYDGVNVSSRIYSNSNSWNMNQWYHVAAVIHPSQGMMLFIDGIKQISTASYAFSTVSSSNNLLLGSWGSTVSRYFNGSIDDVRLSDSALYTSNFTPPCPDLKALNSTIGLWNFNDSSNATVAVDSSANAYNGAIVGAVGTNEQICQTPIASNVVDFDGIDDYIDLGNNVGTGVRTIEMWFKPNASINSQSSNYSPLIVRDENPNNNEFGLTFLPSSVGNSGQLLFYIYDGVNVSSRIYSNSNSWNMNQWYHVAAVIHPSQGMMLFIDGIKQISTASYAFSTVSSSNNLLLGSWGSTVSRYFNGKIDDLRISDSALYTSNFTPPCPDLKALNSTIGLWNFNDSSNATIAVDSSANAYNGAIVGAVGTNDTICSILTSLNNESFDQNLKVAVYPNPFSDNFKLQIPSNLEYQIEDYRIRVYSYSGKQILSQKVSSEKTTVDLSSRRDGIYLYQLIENDRIIYSGKLIKN